MTTPTQDAHTLSEQVREVPYLYKAELNAALDRGATAFQAKGQAPWRFEPAATAGYSAGFVDGWHARDADVAALTERLAQAERERDEAKVAHRLDMDDMRTRLDRVIENEMVLNSEWQAATQRASDLERRLEVIRKHYPTIAGHAIRLQEAGEERAFMEWVYVARDFYAVLYALPTTTDR